MVVASTHYTVTASNSGGNASTLLTMTINDIVPSNLVYAVGAATYVKGTAITPNNPVNVGGAVTSYGVLPTLPAGLTLSTTTGIISGVPTLVSAPASFTVTASNTGGSTTCGLTIKVNDAAPSGPTYTSNPAVYTKGQAITANNPSNGGGTATAYAVSPTLPAGLAMSTTGVITGTPTVILGATTFTITASNISGSTTANVLISVFNPPAPTITMLAPTQGPVGTPAQVWGSNLGFSGTTLTLNGVTIPSFTQTATLLSFTVPGGATTGNLVITTPGGTTSQVFTVNAATTTLDLHVHNVQLTQSVQTLDNSVPIVAAKSGLIRVFVLANQTNTAQPAVQVTLMNNNVAMAGYPKTIAAPTTGVPTAVDESSLSKSWNLAVASTDLTTPIGSGYSVQAVVDPTSALAEADKTNNSTVVPLAGVTVPTFKTTIFPVALATGTGNISEGNKAAWVARLAKMFPIGTVDVVVGATFTDSVVLSSDGTGWGTLLNNLTAKHLADAATDRYYYGALNVSYDSGVAGLGWVPSSSGSAYKNRTAIGWDKTSGYSDGGLFPEVFAHETGHNMGRSHSPCGGVSGADPNYPYAGGSIGVWGYDTVLNALHSPLIDKDIMGYCSPNWVSDYVYKGILTFRNGTGGFLMVGAEDTPLPASLAVAQDCLIVRGIVHGAGKVELLPSFRTRAMPSELPATGEVTLECLNANGEAIFTTPLELMELGCGPKEHDRHFVMALALETQILDAIAGLSVLKAGHVLTRFSSVLDRARLVATPPDLLRLSVDQVQVAWDATVHPTVMVRDGDTGEVLAILSGGRQTIHTKSKQFDLVFSDGVRGFVQRITPIE